MIASVRGTVLAASGSTLVVEVGGVGLAVQAPVDTVLGARLGAEIQLHTALIVREDDLSLFGFSTREELEVFDLLRGVSGVGPKSALGVLSALRPEDVARAVTLDDDAAFRKVSGIGPKTAKLITVQLSGKLRMLAPSAAAAAPSGAGGAAAPASVDQLLAALLSLGWSEREATPVAAQVAAEAAPETALGTLIRSALGRLGTHGVEAGR